MPYMFGFYLWPVSFFFFKLWKLGNTLTCWLVFSSCEQLRGRRQLGNTWASEIEGRIPFPPSTLDLENARHREVQVLSHSAPEMFIALWLFLLVAQKEHWQRRSTLLPTWREQLSRSWNTVKSRQLATTGLGSMVPWMFISLNCVKRPQVINATVTRNPRRLQCECKKAAYHLFDQPAFKNWINRLAPPIV